ncbi:maternal effect protein staufen [Eurosta solidaginis]|uniref:maternal effect protein staufen n=1 Tax=Eurosta solidaginis TaxID=178769 RepID=UPI00353085A5
MQHHAHIARTAPPHMRAHHMAVPPPHSQSQTHVPPLNMTHAPPPATGQQPQVPQHHHQQQQQQQQKQSQHLITGPAGDGAAVITTSSVMRDHQAWLNQQPLPQRQHQQSMHTSTQLQKLRQQHQHINNNNNNYTNSTNKNIYHQQQHSHLYNGSSKAHGNVIQQPQQIVHHQSSSHQNQHQQSTIYHQPQQQQQQHQQHLRAVTSMAPQQPVGHLEQQQQSQQQPQQHQTTLNPASKANTTHHLPLLTTLNSSTASTTQINNNNNNVHKPKYNNNIGVSNACSVDGVGGGGMVPKSILQNPNRISKIPQQNTTTTLNKVVVNKEEPKKVSLLVNKISGSIDAAIVREAPVATVTENELSDVTVGQDNLKNVQSTTQKDVAKDANKENAKGPEESSNTTNEASSSDVEKNQSGNILSNVDSNISKNSREKTPMCHVNELARFNKIIHQYRLTSEKGPAHCKRFTVTLKLGDEEYTAEGFKIKKAQHLAAADALANTKYKHPVPKVVRRNADGDGNLSRANITPTVELNALAMKLGQQTYYLLDPRQNMQSDAIGPLPPDTMMPSRYGGPSAPSHMLPPYGVSGGHMMNHHPPPHLHMMDTPGYGRRNGLYTGPPAPPPPMHGGHASNGSYMPPRYGPPSQYSHISKYNMHQHYPLMAPPHMGGGGGGLHNVIPPPPPQFSQAPHHYRVPHPRYYGMHGVLTRVTLVVGTQKFIGSGHTLQQAKHDAAARALQVLKVQATEKQNEELNNSQEENDKKSPISMVHEIAIQRSMTVHFKVLREEGPAHMKKFVTACIVGNIVAEGEGNGKKISKKRAAENMLDELRKLPPLTPTKTPVKRIKGKSSGKAAEAVETAGGGRGRSSGGGNERRKRGSASIKDKSELDADADNPITRLTQLQQNRKEKDPVFELIAKNGNESSRRREFIVEVTASGMVARGTGNSKKLAKRNAAQNLLLAMGVKEGDSIETNVVAGKQNLQTVDKEKPEASISTMTTLAETDTNLPTCSILPPSAELANCRKVPLVSTPAGKVPGILILRQNKKSAARKKEGETNVSIDDNSSKKIESIYTVIEEPTILPAPAVSESNSDSQVATRIAAKPNVVTTEVSNNVSVSNTITNSDTTTTSSSSSSTSKNVGVHMKEQLLYLSKLMGFEVNFSDYPKGVHSEFLTIVTLSTNPPQICHGVGISIEESQNDAARNALKILSELGLNNAAK